jgi:predicted HTH transcriptional regulator
LSDKLAAAYPPIHYTSKVLERDNKQFLAVVVRGSENRPHFAGQAYVREGSRSVVSSAKQFDSLIAERDSKVRELLKWKNKWSQSELQ